MRAVRFLPKWFPWTTFHKQADEWRHTLFEMTDKSYEVVKKQTVRLYSHSFQLNKN